MRIKEVVRQHRRDMRCIYECEHCGHAVKGEGYDDKNFHENVVPKMVCEECGEIAPANYRPLATKYPEGFQV